MLRGDVFGLRPPRRARGHEQRGRRYGVVLQATELLGLFTVILAPTSTRSLDATFHPRVRIRDELTSVLVEQLSAVDPSRLGDRHGRVTPEELEAIDDALRLVFNLS
ncbi:MAG: type II toxin-antitoxin system PemK/MazF family toxin [Thermoleophilaceae bacterium]